MSPGLVLALASSLTHASADAGRKALANRLPAPEALAAFIGAGLPIVATLWLAAGMTGLPRAGFAGYAALSVAINLIANGLLFHALRLSPLSLTLPFLSFTPVFLIGTSRLINGELPSGGGVWGIALIVLGTLLLHAHELRHGAGGPLRAIVRERGSLLAIAVSALWSVSAAADKAAVLHSGPLCYFTVWHLGMALPLWGWALARRRARAIVSAAPAVMAAAGALHVLAGVLQLSALRLLQATYVIALKRAGMLVGVLYGRLLFGERRLGERLLGATVMVAGVWLIARG